MIFLHQKTFLSNIETDKNFVFFHGDDNFFFDPSNNQFQNLKWLSGKNFLDW